MHILAGQEIKSRQDTILLNDWLGKKIMCRWFSVWYYKICGYGCFSSHDDCLTTPSDKDDKKTPEPTGFDEMETMDILTSTFAYYVNKSIKFYNVLTTFVLNCKYVTKIKDKNGKVLKTFNKVKKTAVVFIF